MFPLQVELLIPSIFVTPVVLLAFYLWRRRGSAYQTIWRWSMVACAILCGLFLTVTLLMPLHSEREKGPEIPGGFSVSPLAAIGELIFWSCIVIPSFPILIGLSYMPPPGRSRKLLLPCLLFVAVLVGLVTWRNAVYAVDYQQTKHQERLKRIQYRQQQQRVQQQLPIQFK